MRQLKLIRQTNITIQYKNNKKIMVKNNLRSEQNNVDKNNKVLEGDKESNHTEVYFNWADGVGNLKNTGCGRGSGSGNGTIFSDGEGYGCWILGGVNDFNQHVTL